MYFPKCISPLRLYCTIGEREREEIRYFELRVLPDAVSYGCAGYCSFFHNTRLIFVRGMKTRCPSRRLWAQLSHCHRFLRTNSFHCDFFESCICRCPCRPSPQASSSSQQSSSSSSSSSETNLILIRLIANTPPTANNANIRDPGYGSDTNTARQKTSVDFAISSNGR
mmetsp:Transcript_6167/g.15360  ORF Transcript_6167/g.15360 Transcript_6167/m.15360 type:complete len:168 (-) Transcript_6167:175-678(-)